MPTRIKPSFSDLPVISSLEEVDAILAEIAGQRRQIVLIDLGAAERIEQIKFGAATECEPARQRIATLEQALTRYADYRKPELFAKKKSLALTFGVIGYRSSTKLKPLSKWTWERVLAALKEKEGGARCVRVKEEVDKDALKALAPEQLAEVGVKAVTEDAFYYELDEPQSAVPDTGDAA